MTPKERASMQQALNLLESEWPEGDEIVQPVIASLLEALAEQAEQEPVLHVGDSSFEDWYQAHPKASGGDKQLARDAYVAGMGDPLVAPVKQEPVAWMHKQRNAVVYSALEMQCFPYKERQFFTPLYAAPVRTKDLTDDEKADLLESVDWYNFPEDLINAAIAADRSKNK